MIIRPMTHSDALHLEELSEVYYPEFNAPEFEDNYFGKFTIVKSDGTIILGGGLRYLAEVVLVTDKSQNKHLVGDALIKALGHSINEAKKRNIDFLHAFVKDEKYQKHLISHGFEPRDGQALSLFVRSVNGS
jgi:hypothetical protein